MSNGGLQQGPMAGSQAAGLGAQEARETSLSAVLDDANTISNDLASLDQTVQRLQEHLMGQNRTTSKGEDGLVQTERPTPTGTLPILCMLGSDNIRHLHRIQERLNQLCYELGEGR